MRDIKFGGTPLIWAAIRGQTDMVKLLLEKGSDINVVESKNVMYSLVLAAFLGSTGAAKLLLEKGADVNAKDNGGRTALSLAKDIGRSNILEMLVKAGAVEGGK